MSKLYAAFVLILSACLLNKANAQSIINPADTIVNYTASSNPTQPAYGTIGKWGRTPSLGWNTSEWKCYVLDGFPFRVHFPTNYVPGVNDGKLYPMLVFFHGLGEAGPVTDNETQLYHGGQVFQTAIDNGTFNGYAIAMQSTGFFSSSNYTMIAQIIDYMIANNKVDMSRISLNGLSAGGQACWSMFEAYPQYVAGNLPMSAMSLTYDASSDVQQMKFTPFWYFQGGQDTGPDPATTAQVLPYFYNAGCNFTYTLFPTQGHDTWDSAWLMPNFWPFINANNIANPWTLFGRTAFCPGNSINVTIGLVPGMTAYQWRYNGTVISGATTNSITATQAGTYDARVERGSIWSGWSPVPVQIIVQGATQTPNITLATNQTDALPGADGTNSVTLALPAGDSTYSWQKLGSSTVLSTTNKLTVSTPGDYIASDIPRYGCSSIPSPSFEVINANGPNPPTAATSLVANALSFTKVQLTWATQPNPTYAPTAFEVYRATKSGGPYTFLGQTTPTVLTYTDSSLSAGTPYYYVIRAIDTAGAAPLSVQATATTLADKVPPTAPGNLKVQYTTSSAIDIIWNTSTDNVGVDHYNIYVNGSLEDVAPVGDTTFILNGLTQGKWYSIYVVAVDGSGNVSNNSNQVDAGAVYSGLVYKYYASSTIAPTSLSMITTMPQVATGVTPNTNINLYTGTTTTDFGYIWTGYITIPVNGTYTFATSSDDGSALWFNSLTPTGTATVNNDGPHGTTTVSSSALNLTAGTYPICIEYFQEGGGYAMTTMWSCQQLNGNTTLVAIPNQYFASTATPPGTAPNRPTSVRATATAYNKINLSWINNGGGQTGFEVYRSTSASGPFSIVTTTGSGATSFTDSTLAAATTYYYEVQAINSYGGSGFDSLSIGGINYKFYVGAFGSPMPNYNTLTPTATGHLTNVSIAPAGSVTTDFGFLFAGNIKAPVTGTYTFSTNSDDASALYIGGYPGSTYEVVNNDFQQGATTRSGTIALTAGQYYPIYVTYDQGTGSYVLTTYWKLPGSSTTTTIPDSAFANPNWTATTLPLPSIPVIPILTGTATSSSKNTLSWTDTSSYITGYTLDRSINDSLHYQLLSSNLTSANTSYADSGLFGHQLYYYKIQASGPGGTSAFTPSLPLTTQDNFPVVSAIANQAARYGTTTTINVTATDKDGDALTFSGVNLPTWATIASSSNGSAVLTLTPAQANQGVYPGIGVSVSDGHGGVTTSTFTLTVNNNYPPVLTPVSPVSVNTGTALSIPLTATSPSGDNMTFTVTGAPNTNTLVAGPNGSDTLKLNPTYGATGSYTVTVTVNDGNGGIVNETFPVTVSFVAPTKQIYLRINDGDAVGSPWNNITGQVTTGIVDNTGAATGWTFNLNTSWWGGAALGPTTGNNSGVYPDAILKDFYFFGDYGAPATIAPTLSGLDTTKLYNITFFASSVFNDVPNNGTTVYTVNGQSVSLYVQDNLQNTVTLTNIKPASNGTITITMSMQSGSVIGYINALVVTQLFNDGTKPLSPYNLSATLGTGSNVVLNWADSAYNESGYQIWRATSPTGPWTQVLPNAAAKATTFTDATTAGYTTYYYEVNAYNAAGNSYYTNVVSIATPDKVPTLNAISNVSLNWGTTDTVHVTTTNATGNTVTLKASGLPSFVTFTDNGNGTGTLVITAPDSATGTYTTPVITLTDEADSVRTAAFAITVKNPQVSSVFIHISDGVNFGAAPWNNVTVSPAPGYGMSGLLNDAGANSGLSLTYQNGFQGTLDVGERPGNNSGIYPDPVMRSAAYDARQQTDSILLSGLNTGMQYNFQVFSSADWGVSGPTAFTLLGKTDSLNPAFNASNVAQFSNLTPRPNGTVSLAVTKAARAQYSFLNDIVVQGFDSVNVGIFGPSYLHVTQTLRNSVSLAWVNNAWNSTGYQVWRTTDSTGVYYLVATLPAGATTFTNTGLTSNTTYYYTVRALKGPIPSTYSNPVAVTTSSYAIYLELNQPNLNIAGLPWNSLNQQPATGTTWTGFYDDQGNPTSTGMVLNGLWAGTSNLGMQTGNNSGAVPDAVMLDSYVLFAGQSGGFTLNGLNINNTYDVTFFGSINFQADGTTVFTVNGQPVTLDASLNTNSTVTAYGVKPNQSGVITINVNPATASTEYGIVNAIILRAYTKDSNSIPAPPLGTYVATPQVKTMTSQTDDVAAPLALEDKDTIITAYPNPFNQSFTLQVPAQASGDKAVVQMYSVSGTTVYAGEFKDLVAGPNYLTITPGGNLLTGVYVLRVSMNDGKSGSKTIKLIKQ